MALARFYLDEDVTEKLVAVLLDLGYDVVSTKQRGRKGSRDFEQFLLAAVERRVLITFNAEDFRLLHGAWLAWSRAWNVQSTAVHQGVLIIEPGSGQDGPLSLSLLSSVVQSFVALPGTTINRLFVWNARHGLYEAG